MNTDNIPENKPKDDAVLNAFSKNFETEAEFRARWKSTVEQAEKHREERRIAQEERQRAEEERKARIARGLNPRVGNETHPGRPLDIKKLSEISAASKAWEVYSDETPEEKTPHYTEPDSFEFNIVEATAAEKTVCMSSKPVDYPSVKDRKTKKTVKQKLHYRVKTTFSKVGFKRFVNNNIPVKGDAGGEIARKCIRAVSFIALLCAMGYIIYFFTDYSVRKSATNEFEEEMNSLAAIEEDELEDAWAEIKAEYPDVNFPDGMNIKFSDLYSINQNVVGWLKIDNTNINTVLLQGSNNTYYLKTNIYGEYTRYGNPYVHYKCKMGKDGLSKNTILFGHNANDGLMFHDLINYMTVDGYLDAPIVTLDTLYEQTKWKIFAVVLTNTDPDDDNGHVWTYLYTDFSSDASFESWLSQIQTRNIIHTGVDVNSTDKVLTLYTCCRYVVQSGRLVVFARQLRDGESEEVDKSDVYYNSSARYPQAWYDKKGKTNPYAGNYSTGYASVSIVKESTTASKSAAEKTTAESKTTVSSKQTTVAESTTKAKSSKKNNTKSNTTSEVITTNQTVTTASQEVTTSEESVSGEKQTTENSAASETTKQAQAETSEKANDSKEKSKTSETTTGT